MPIRIQRLMDQLTALGEIGRQPGGGITRLAFSDAYFQAARVLSERLFRGTGCEVYHDFTGSVHGIRPGSCPELPQIVIGSHLDTVPEGGLYDGLAGIAAGMEILNALEEDGTTLRHTLHLVAFNAEEAGPLGGTFASRTLMGLAEPSPEGGAALAGVERRFSGAPLRSPGLDDLRCFLELHIEQGGVLDQEQVQAGAVTGIFGIRRYRIVLTGQSNHAGTTPMSHRQDPMVNAARLIALVYQRARSFGKELVATVGKVQVTPNLESVIPGQVELVVEMRSLSDGYMDQLLEEITDFARSFAGPAEQDASWPTTACSITLQVEKPPILLDQGLTDLVKAVCRRLELSCIPIPSGAGHDAKSFAAAGVPTGMIFIPSLEGKSHCPEERTLPEQLEYGAKILYEMIREMDTEALTAQAKDG